MALIERKQEINVNNNNNNCESGGEDGNFAISELFRRRNLSTSSSTSPLTNNALVNSSDFNNEAVLSNVAANSPPHPSDDEDFVDGDYLMGDDENGLAAAFLNSSAASGSQFASLRNLNISKIKNGNYCSAISFNF